MSGRLRDVLACLDDVEAIVWEPYRHDGAGRPPRNPAGILKALVVKRVRNIPSDRELYRRLWSDPELRELCDIEGYEKPYHPSQLSRFRQRIGPERLKRLYAFKASAERTISRLKQHLSLENHKVRGLRNILIHALLCTLAMLLTAIKTSI